MYSLEWHLCVTAVFRAGEHRPASCRPHLCLDKQQGAALLAPALACPHLVYIHQLLAQLLPLVDVDVEWVRPPLLPCFFAYDLPAVIQFVVLRPLRPVTTCTACPHCGWCALLCPLFVQRGIFRCPGRVRRCVTLPILGCSVSVNAPCPSLRSFSFNSVFVPLTFPLPILPPHPPRIRIHPCRHLHSCYRQFFCQRRDR
jgi:hypothetical protein